MAIVKMKRFRLLAIRSEGDKLLRELQKLGCVEISDQSDRLADPELAALVGREEADTASRRTDLNRLQLGLTLLDRYAPVKTGMLTPKPTIAQEEFLDDAEMAGCLAAAREMEETDNRIRRIQAEEAALRSRVESLTPWRDLQLPLDSRGTEQCVALTGTLPGALSLEEIGRELAEAAPEAEIFPVYSDDDQHCLLLVALKATQQSAMEYLRSKGFSLTALGALAGTALENIHAAEAQLAELAGEREALAAELAGMGELREAMKRCADRARTDLSRAEAQERLLGTETALALEGWVSAPEAEAVAALLESYDCAWEMEDPAEEDYPVVPVKLKNNALTHPLNMVTEMYSLPAYNGLDPNPLMAPFFILFYGMMMADMGYGLLMLLAGLIVSKKGKPGGMMGHMFKLMISCGISTFIWGALTGGFFGDAPLQVAKIFNPNTTWTGLPALFSPLDDALMVLIGSLALGLIQILTGMAISFYKQAKRGELMAALCNEGAWFLVFVALAVGILTKQLKIALIVIVVILVLTQGYGKKGIVGKLMGIGGSLYNNITGYFSDILSYSRLMALMLAGAVIAQVFNTLGAITGNIVTFLLISLIGNALNFALNLLGCFVHDMRLQCLEFFGRFYEDGGKPFKPLKMESNYVNIVKE